MFRGVATSAVQGVDEFANIFFSANFASIICICGDYNI